MIKRILLGFLAVVVILLFANFNLVSYAISQARGQLKIVWGARPVVECLNDPNISPEFKKQLELIQEIRQYAFDSLGIKRTKNYTTFYDQHGKELLWVVTACDPFMLKPKEWSFPLIGTFSYKGFFNQQRATDLEHELKTEGYDTNIRNASGWSTLGWFRDPILSDMLDNDPGHLAELIIHELTHGTLFVKDSLRFNENLASFVGSKGAEMFLAHHYGKNSSEFKSYVHAWIDRRTVASHMLRGAYFLDSLYHTFNHSMTKVQKLNAKTAAIGKIIEETDTLHLYRKQEYEQYYDTLKPNNTYFMSFLRYRGDFEKLEMEYNIEYHRNIVAMLSDYKKKYPSL